MGENATDIQENAYVPLDGLEKNAKSHAVPANTETIVHKIVLVKTEQPAIISAVLAYVALAGVELTARSLVLEVIMELNAKTFVTVVMAYPAIRKQVFVIVLQENMGTSVWKLVHLEHMATTVKESVFAKMKPNAIQKTAVANANLVIEENTAKWFANMDSMESTVRRCVPVKKTNRVTTSLENVNVLPALKAKDAN